MNPDVVIVGAGPVGLFTAIEMMLLNPTLKIKIIDRNKEYTRHHILKLEEESLINSNSYKTYEEVRKLHGFVPTSEIESTFLKIARELNVEIETGVKVEDSKELLNQYPTAHTIIGADGAHSIVRRQIFDDKKIVDTNLQYIVEIKYQAKGATSRLPNLVYGPALGQVPHLVSENVGKEKEGSTPVSLFIFVDEETYKEIRETPNAKLTDLYPKTKCMEQLMNTIRPWLSLRRAALNEEMVTDSEKINGVALSVYQSECFAKELNGKRVYLVGDAAAAVPYFRALNAGLIAATVTAQKIAAAGANSPDLESLNKQLAELTQVEIKKAHDQNKKVNFGRGLNFFLASASKITTGALLNPKYEEAMLNARVTRPHIFRRNPRTVMIFGLFLLMAALLFTVALASLAMPLWPSTLLALAGATAIVGTCILLFKLTTLIIDIIKDKSNPIQPLPAFPWENEDKEEDSLLPLSKLTSNPSKSETPSPQQEQDIAHYPSPLKQKRPEQTISMEPGLMSYSIN
ncbi:FAD-dependent monooxygenase family protein [Legionella fallonii]|nr:hypothetical protein [Legionella fallonii]